MRALIRFITEPFHDSLECIECITLGLNDRSTIEMSWDSFTPYHPEKETPEEAFIVAGGVTVGYGGYDDEKTFKTINGKIVTAELDDEYIQLGFIGVDTIEFVSESGLIYKFK